MATVSVPTSWITLGALPACCARHGGPATRADQRKFYTRTPWWVYLFIPVGLLIAAVIALAIRGTVDGPLPSCESCARERRRWIRTVWSLWGLDLALLAASIAAANSPIGKVAAGLWLLVTLVALVWSSRADRIRVTGRVSKDRNWVELRRVSDVFQNAVTTALQASTALPATTNPQSAWAYPQMPVPDSVGTPAATTGDAIGRTWATPGYTAPPSIPAPTAVIPDPQWAADPTGRHQYRWWDGTRWTDQVHNAGVTSTDR